MEALEVVELWPDNASSLAISATVHCRRAWSLLNSPQNCATNAFVIGNFPLECLLTTVCLGLAANLTCS